MTWFMAGAAAISVGTSYLSAQSAANSQAKAAGAASRAEGEAIVRERLNKTISNSYATAFAQLRLNLQKRQLSQQQADVSAAALAARGDVTTLSAASGSIGSSVDAVLADIEQKSDAAVQSTHDAWENAMLNYNNDLDMMVLNTDQSAPNVRRNEYVGPSTGSMAAGALLHGLSQFASQYAMQRMSLGLGSPSTPTQAQTAPVTNPYALTGSRVRFGG